MVPAPRWWLAVVFLVVTLRVPASSQSSQIEQFLPEVDVYTGITPSSQFWFQAKQTREDGEPNQAEIGPTLDFFIKPLILLKEVTLFDLDDAKKRVLVLSVGYRYLPSPGQPAQNRILVMATGNFPIKSSLLVSDRNRLEINFTNGNASWRYRNRLTLQRTIAVRSYHPSLYASAEFYYNSRYNKWSDTALDAGFIFPFGRKVELNPYYEHQNSTGKSPNQQINAIGLILNLFFRSSE